MFCIHCGNSIPEEANFCSSCGKSSTKPISKDPTDSSSDIISNNHVESRSLSEFTLISDTISCGFLGEDGQILDKVMGESMGVKSAFKLKHNLYASSDFFIVVPVSKDKGAIALFGLLLGGGGIAAGAMGALSVLANRIEQKNANKIMDTNDPFYNALIFKTSDITVKVKETRLNSEDLFDIFKKQTHFLVSGKGLYKNKEYSLSVYFSFEGQASDPTKKRIPVYDVLFKSLNIVQSPIYTGKNPPF